MTRGRSLLAVLAAVCLTLPAAPAAGKPLPKNSVSSKQIKNKGVKKADLATGAVTRRSIGAGAVDGTNVLDGALSGFDLANDSVRGAQIDEASLDLSVLQARIGACPAGEAIRSVDAFGRPTCLAVGVSDVGALGGDLTGTLPNPTIANDAINSLKVLNDSLTGGDLDETTLGKVPNADLLDGIDSAAFLLDSEAGDFLTETTSFAGDLSGQFDALQLGNNIVGTDEVALNALGTADINESNLTGADISGVDAAELGGVSLSAIDSRLDALCAQADAVNQEVRDLRAALDIPALTGGGIGLDLSSVNLPDFDPAPCQG